MSDFVRTGVFADKQEIETINELAAYARATPVIALSTAHGMQGGFSGDAWDRVNKAIYRCALVHGLPEIKGYYGFDGSNGEFLDNETIGDD